MKYLFIILGLLFVKNVNAQFTGTDSLRNYNIKYITNNPATAFTNLRLHTLLRGMIDWIDTARAGTGGGGALGVDTLWALNDSTIRYKANGVFRNFILRGVYDTRRKVDTAYALNDSTLQIKINGTNRNIILPGRHWNLQGVLNNGSTLTENENIVLADSLEFTSGWVIIDSLRLRSLVTKIDTTANKPIVVDASGNVHKMAGWPGVSPPGITELTGDGTAGPGSGSQALTISPNAVTNAKLAQAPGLSVIGNIGNSTDDVGYITAANDGNILRRFGTSIGFGTINLASTNAVGSSVLPVLNGGTGTSTPGLVQGTNVTITGTWPNQTINSSGSALPLDNVLALGGRLSANRSVSMAHRRWDLDSAVLRLRGVDSAALGIDLAKGGDIIRINKPEGVARTYPGSTSFKFIMENSTDDVPEERNNPVKWGWNINRADSTSAPGIWYSMEPNYRPGGARWLEIILEASLPNGTAKNSRLFMSTFKRGAGDSIESAENQWDFRGTGWSFMNLTSTVGYVGMGAGTLNVNNANTGPTDFSITNGTDESHFNLAPGTGMLNYSGAPFLIDGHMKFKLRNQVNSERALMAFEVDGGQTGYIGQYGSAWGAQAYLQNAMVMTNSNGGALLNPALALMDNGTSFLGDVDTYHTGTHNVNLSGTLGLRGIGTVTTAPRILVWTSDSTARGMDTAAFRTMMGIGGGGSDGNGIYSGSGSLSGNTTVTGSNNSLTFDDIFAFKINSDYNVIAKANGTGIYSEAVVGSSNTYEIGYTPVQGVFSKGAGVIIDTNNNVGIAANPPTAMPLYSTGTSLFVQGLQSNHGNFYKVSNTTSDITLSLQVYFYTIDASGGNVTITLPGASSAFGNTMGITYKFQRTDNSGNTVTIQRAGSDTINGATSFTLTSQYQVKQIQCTSTSTWAQW